ncbi:hypothetical protein IWQ62_005487 [Dispira parvispora]|uniref:Uncharacterized protein n=1 Tax=Dispira parvispora TaxID=1520584 RepID=A0A9W8E573_9FUNG|nr:hypothetical protein IWQ62_005487 [Dispira parvispora]
MRVSLLGLGTLAYWLALLPNVLANEPSVCSDFRREFSTEDLQSPRGLITKIMCPSLRDMSTTFDATKAIKSLSHDDLLTLFPAEVRQMGYLAYKTHRRKTELYSNERVILYSRYQLSPATHRDGHSLSDEKLEKFKSLTIETTPLAPKNGNTPALRNSIGFGNAADHFVHPGVHSPDNGVKRLMVDLEATSDMDLLDFSPVFFLLRYKKPVEAWILIKELIMRGADLHFLVAVKRVLGVFYDAYPMYFTTSVNILSTIHRGIERPVLAENFEDATLRCIFPNFFKGVFRTGDEKLVKTLLEKIGTDGNRYVFFRIFYWAAMDNSYLDEAQARALISTEVTWHTGMTGRMLKKTVSDVLRRREPNELKFDDMVTGVRNSKMTYANVTIDR